MGISFESPYRSKLDTTNVDSRVRGNDEWNIDDESKPLTYRPMNNPGSTRPNCGRILPADARPCRCYSFVVRSRKALEMTETELKLMATPAIIGLSSTPKNGYSKPAATGMPRAL